VAHPLARRRLEPGDVADHGLGDAFGDEGGGPFLVVAADLSGEDDQLGLGI
jgi:hypothetical protein